MIRVRFKVELPRPRRVVTLQSADWAADVQQAARLCGAHAADPSGEQAYGPQGRLLDANGAWVGNYEVVERDRT
jgi:hypothetical protein